MRFSHFTLVSLLAILVFASSCASSKRGKSAYSSKRMQSANMDDVYASSDDYVVIVKPDKKSKKTSGPKTTKTSQSKKDQVDITAFREEVYETASQYLGLAYRSGGRSPSTGFDCSGFTAYVMGQHGIKISGSSVSMSKLGEPKARDQLEVGDLLFFGKNGNIHHVGIVAKNENGELEMIHSASSVGISIDVIERSRYWSNRFMFGRDIITPHLLSSLNNPAKE